MPSLIVIGPQIKEKQRFVPPAYIVPKDPSLNRVKFINYSSIEHGGTRTFSNIMAPLTLFNEAPKRKSVSPLALKNAYLWLSWPSLMRGYQDIFQYVGIFVRYFLWRGEGGYVVFLAYDNGMVPR